MKLSTPFVKLPLQFDAERLAAEVAALPDSAWVKHPTGFQGNGAVRLISAGGDENDDMGGAMLPTPHLERSPYIQQVLATFNTVFGRSRLMGLGPHSEVPAHSDVNHHWFYRVRIHVPIMTFPEVRFYCEDRDVHMGAGEAWIFDNWRRHWVVNPTDKLRVHLVADTSGSSPFWEMVNRGVDPFDVNAQLDTRRIAFDPSARVQLATERFNMADVMPPAEMAFLVNDLLEDLNVATARNMHDRALADAFVRAAKTFVADWRDVWVQFGSDKTQWPRYQALRQKVAAAVVGKKLRLASNNSPATPALMGRVVLPCLNLPLDVAAPQAAMSHDKNVGFIVEPVVDQGDGAHAGRTLAGNDVVTPAAAPSNAPQRKHSRFDRPLIILTAPRSGSTLLFETLQQSQTLCTIGGESHGIIEALPQLNPASGAIDSNRLDQIHATVDVVAELHKRFGQFVRNASGVVPAPDARVRLLEKTPKNALRIPFLETLFPDARYVFLYRDPREAMSSIMDCWENGNWITYPKLKDWQGSWSFLLPPGWQAMKDKSRAEIAAFQWQRANEFIVNDLQTIDSNRWMALDYADFLADPAMWTSRIAAFAEIPFDAALAARTSAALPHSRLTLTAPKADKWRKNEASISPFIAQTMAQFSDIKAFTNTHHERVGCAEAAQTEPTIAAVGRNDLCPCGSQLRYKHCHGKLA